MESQGTIQVVVELNSPSASTVTVPFSVTGTAVQGAGADYQITSSPLYIPAGDTTATIYITLNNDGLEEGDESLVLGIDSPINATRGPQYIHSIKIIDPPVITFKEVASTHQENSPTSGLMVELSKGSPQDVTVSFTYGGSAVWGAAGDYLTSPVSLTVPSGSLSAMLTLDINDDTLDEDDETAVIQLDSPVNGVLGSDDTHTLTIIDNDAPPLISFYAANQVVSEEIGKFTTTLSLSEPSGKVIVVPYSLSGTTIPEDYLIHDSSPLTIPPGSSSVDISMDILEGDGMEPDETLIITLGTPQNASLGAVPEQTIVITESSTEPLVTFAGSSQTVVEGDLAIDLDVQLSNAWSVPVLVHFSVSGSANMGSGGDFMMSSSPLEIPVGWTQGTIQVVIREDDVDENTENIFVSIDAIENGLAGAIMSTEIQIQDDDAPPEVSFLTANKTKSESGGTITVNLGLSSQSVHDVSVPLVLSGTATLNSDYAISTQNVTVPAGSTTGSFQISLNDDLLYDPDEIIEVSLGSPMNAELGSPATFTLAISDNDLPPCKVGAHLLTIGTNSFSLSMVNEGEELIFSGGSVTWINAGGNKPRLVSGIFAGTQVFSGDEKPTSYSYSAAVPFSSLATESVSYQFSQPLGSGEHRIVSNFYNPVDGSACSLTEIFTVH